MEKNSSNATHMPFTLRLELDTLPVIMTLRGISGTTRRGINTKKKSHITTNRSTSMRCIWALGAGMRMAMCFPMINLQMS